MLKIQYRYATLSDLDQLVELRLLMQEDVHGVKLDSVKESKFRADVRAYFMRSIDDGSYFSPVAEVNGELVAAAGVVAYQKPPSIYGGMGKVGYVTNVYTNPEWRGKGVAGELIRMVVEYGRAQGFDKLHLGATESGKSVYERAGFHSPQCIALEIAF